MMPRLQGAASWKLSISASPRQHGHERFPTVAVKPWSFGGKIRTRRARG
jgi:hypothetical protein